MAVIAPGTGLGEAFLTWDGSRYRPFPSEGGHADFGPTNGLEIGLLRYLLEKFERVSYERVCSGRGLPNIYAYLRDNRNAEEPTWLTKRPENAHAYADETLARFRELVDSQVWREPTGTLVLDCWLEPTWNVQGMLEVVHLFNFAVS